MKIAVTSSRASSEAAVDPNLRTCACFALVDTDDMSIEILSNESRFLESGSGIQAALWLAQHGVQVVLTGRCGPNARRTLNAAGIDVLAGYGGTVAEAIDRFRSDRAAAQKSTTVAARMHLAR